MQDVGAAPAEVARETSHAGETAGSVQATEAEDLHRHSPLPQLLGYRPPFEQAYDLGLDPPAVEAGRELAEVHLRAGPVQLVDHVRHAHGAVTHDGRP